MFLVCPACGVEDAEKGIDPRGPHAVCPRCGHRHRFRRFPLLVVAGASGAGKTTVCLALAGRVRRAVVLETDVLWGSASFDPADDYRAYRRAWLRIALNVSQAGRPVVLCGFAPGSLDGLPEARYFAAVRYLALVCDADALAGRLRRRAAWRELTDDAFVDRALAFNARLRATAPDQLDTTNSTPEETAAHVLRWIEAHLR
jgi:broad-specificity NMP kinase